MGEEIDTEFSPTTEREATFNSKRVMIRAENGDSIKIGDNEYFVDRRSETFYGPKLWLHPVDGSEQVKLTAPGMNHDLQLWHLEEDESGFPRWCPGEEVSAELVDYEQYVVCDCGEPIKDSAHYTWASFGVGEHGR